MIISSEKIEPPVEKLILSLSVKTKSPEEDALKHYIKHGWQGVNDEGELLFLLIKCCSFMELPETAYKLNKGEKHNKNYFGVYHRIITEQMRIKPKNRYWPFSKWGTVDERLEDILSMDEQTVVRNFSLIKENTYYGSLKSGYKKFYEKYNKEYLVSVFRLLGNEVISEMFLIMCSKYTSKYNYRIRYDVGWPDLIIFNSDSILFREIKTANDTIKENQVNNYNYVFRRLGLDYKITKLLYQ